MSYGGGGIPFPGSQPQYVNPNAAYGAPQGQYGAPQAQFGASQGQFGASPGQYGGVPPAQYGGQMGGQMGLMPPTSAATAATADPYANAKPGTIAYAKSEGPDGIATYTPVIAQETTYNTPTGQIRGIKWVTATSSQASAAGIPPGAVTASNAAQLPQAAGMMPPMNLPGGIPPPGSAITAAGYPPGFGPGGGGFVPPGAGGFAPSPADEYPIMKPGMSQREYEKAVRKWEKNQDKERRAAEKRARKEEKERKQTRDWDRDAQDPYDITGGRGGERQRRMSTGGGLGFERARRMSGGAMLREDDLSRKLESLDMSFNSRRERKMSGGQAYAPSAAGGGFRSRKNSVSEAGGRDRRISGDYGQLPRTSFYPPAGAGIPGGGGYGAPVPGGYGAGARSMPGSPVRPHSAFPPSTHHDDIARGGPSPRPGTYYSRSRHASPSMGSTHLPGGYGGSTYGGARDPASASAYPYGTERTPYSTASNLPPAGGDSYALTRRPAGGAPSSLYPVSGRELNRAQPFTAFEEFFLVEDLNELMQPQPPPLPAALVPHDVMADEWDRCMHGLISLASQILQQQSSRSSALDPLIELITQWNTTFFLPRGVDISIYKGNSRRSGPAMHPSALRSYDESESESESSSSSSSESSESEDDRYFSSARREQKAAKKAERKARRKDRHRRRRARRRQRSVSIRIRAVPLH